MASGDWQNDPKTKGIVDFVRRRRRKAGIDVRVCIKPADEHDFGRIGQYLFNELLYTPEFEGSWDQLSDPQWLATVHRRVVFEDIRSGER